MRPIIDKKIVPRLSKNKLGRDSSFFLSLSWAFSSRFPESAEAFVAPAAEVVLIGRSTVAMVVPDLLHVVGMVDETVENIVTGDGGVCDGVVDAIVALGDSRPPTESGKRSRF